MSDYLLAIDIGTSSTRAIIFSKNGEVIAQAQKELSLSYPHNGWVEQDPVELVDKTFAVIKQVLSYDEGVSKSIAGAGITNQRETVIIWDRETGKPIYNAVVWQDRRTDGFCTTLKRKGLENKIQSKTGLLLDPYFSATKIKWILENVDGAKKRARNGDLLFGTVDCYLLWHLSGGRVHATDASNASRTMLYNIIGHSWDNDLLEIFEVPRVMLPKVMDNISNFVQINKSVFGVNLTIWGVAGDQQAALIGQGCVSPSMVKATYGTGCFMLMNIGDKAIISDNKLLTTIGFSVDGKVSYALEGSIFNAGTALQFLRDNFGFFDDVSESEKMAFSLSDNGGVYFVPAFTGLGAPYWQPEARGIICGLGRDSSKEHIVRAALEAQAYQTRDLIEIMQTDSGKNITSLRIDGGLVANRFMCQFLSEQLGLAIEIPRFREASAWGAACLAGVGAGVFPSIDDTAKNWQVSNMYNPVEKSEDMDAFYSMWKSAVDKICN